MDWSHILTAAATAIVALLGAWTTRRHELAKINKTEIENRKDEWAVIRNEWEQLLTEERETRKRLMDRSDQIEKNREELREKLAAALTEVLELKTRLQWTEPNQERIESS